MNTEVLLQQVVLELQDSRKASQMIGWHMVPYDEAQRHLMLHSIRLCQLLPSSVINEHRRHRSRLCGAWLFLPCTVLAS